MRKFKCLNFFRRFQSLGNMVILVTLLIVYLKSFLYYLKARIGSIVALRRKHKIGDESLVCPGRNHLNPASGVS